MPIFAQFSRITRLLLTWRCVKTTYMKELLSTLDTLTINLGAGEMLLVNFILAFVMFGVALGIKVQTFNSWCAAAVGYPASGDLPLDHRAKSIYHPNGCYWYDFGGIVSWW